MKNWTCDGCGELHDSQFDSCWKCGALRVEDLVDSDSTTRTPAPALLPILPASKSEARSTWYSQIVGNMRKKTSDELVEILNKRDTDEWSKETFLAAEEVLTERGFVMSVHEPNALLFEQKPADLPEDRPEYFSSQVLPQVTEQAHEPSCTEPNPMEIFIAKREQRAGPFTIQQIETMISSGMVEICDMAWHTELPDWLPLHQVLGICPPVPRATPAAERTETKAPQAKKVSDLLACVFFGALLFLFLLMGVSGLALAVRSLGSNLVAGVQIIAGPILSVIFLSLGYAALLAYRHFHRRYLGRLPQDYLGAYGTKIKPTETSSGLLMGGGILLALISGVPIPFLDFALMVLAAILFAFSFDRARQRKFLKQLQRRKA